MTSRYSLWAQEDSKNRAGLGEGAVLQSPVAPLPVELRARRGLQAGCNDHDRGTAYARITPDYEDEALRTVATTTTA